MLTMKTCKDCIHSDVCVRQKIYGEYSITECKGHFLGKADVQEVKHGEWVSLEQEIGLYGCSLCEHKILRKKCNFCPNCGAKMDKRSEGK